MIKSFFYKLMDVWYRIPGTFSAELYVRGVLKYGWKKYLEQRAEAKAYYDSVLDAQHPWHHIVTNLVNAPEDDEPLTEQEEESVARNLHLLKDVRLWAHADIKKMNDDNFAQAVAKYLSIDSAHRIELADYAEVAATTVDRWALGTSNPNPRIQKSVLDYIQNPSPNESHTPDMSKVFGDDDLPF